MKRVIGIGGIILKAKGPEGKRSELRQAPGGH